MYISVVSGDDYTLFHNKTDIPLKIAADGHWLTNTIEVIRKDIDLLTRIQIINNVVHCKVINSRKVGCGFVFGCS